MTTKTHNKARGIYETGGVDQVYYHTYRVESTSGETYLVDTKRERCDCRATVTCSHMVAVEMFRCGRRRRTRARLAA